jgi:6-methylsalicylate decarboxylase
MTAAPFVNDQYAALVKRHPDRLRRFAATPMPHVKDSIAEIGRALDELGMVASGVLAPAGGSGSFTGSVGPRRL